MITIDVQNNQISIAVLGEFTLADFKQFEESVLHGIQIEGRVDLLIDLRDMVSYTVDVMWEEIKFSRAHEREFGKVAVVTENQWVTWTAWLQRFFVNADIEVFADYDAATHWMQAA